MSEQALQTGRKALAAKLQAGKKKRIKQQAGEMGQQGLSMLTVCMLQEVRRRNVSRLVLW